MLPFTEGELGSATVVSRTGYWSMLGCRIFYLHKRALLLCLPFSGQALFPALHNLPLPTARAELASHQYGPLFFSVSPSSRLRTSLYLWTASIYAPNSIYLFSPSLACSRHLHFDSIHHSAVNITEYFIRCLSLASTWRSATIKAPPGFEEMQNFTGK